MVIMCLDNSQDLLANLRTTINEKGDSVKADDLLIPELRWVIDCTPLSETDRRFAELRYIQGKRSKDIMEDLGWYSTKTFTSHNKKVWAKLVQTLRRLVG